MNNASLLNSLAMQSLKKVIVRLSFVVYQYAPVNSKCFTRFLSSKGVTSPKGGGDDGAPISALEVGAAAQEDPRGIHNDTRELTLAPPIVNTPQQILIQTSDSSKMLQPWGIPR